MAKLHSKKTALEKAHQTMLEIIKNQPDLLAASGERSPMLNHSGGLAGRNLADNIKALHEGLTQFYLEMDDEA